MSTEQPNLNGKIDVLDALDALSRVQDLLEAIFMMATALNESDQCDAFQRVSILAQDGLVSARVLLGDTDEDEGGE